MYRKLEILIIDDDPFMLALTKQIVSFLVARERIRIFSSARSAIEYLCAMNDFKGNAAEKMGVILTDLEMPDMDGFEFMDEFDQLSRVIREQYAIFALSSTQNQLYIQRLIEKPCFAGFISKPLTVENFEHLLKQIVRR